MGDDGFRVIEAQVSQEAFESMLYKPMHDAIGPAAYAELDELVGATVRAIR